MISEEVREAKPCGIESAARSANDDPAGAYGHARQVLIRLALSEQELDDQPGGVEPRPRRPQASVRTRHESVTPDQQEQRPARGRTEAGGSNPRSGTGRRAAAEETASRTTRESVRGGAKRHRLRGRVAPRRTRRRRSLPLLPDRPDRRRSTGGCDRKPRPSIRWPSASTRLSSSSRPTSFRGIANERGERGAAPLRDPQLDDVAVREPVEHVEVFLDEEPLLADEEAARHRAHGGPFVARAVELDLADVKAVDRVESSVSRPRTGASQVRASRPRVTSPPYGTRQRPAKGRRCLPSGFHLRP